MRKIHLSKKVPSRIFFFLQEKYREKVLSPAIFAYPLSRGGRGAGGGKSFQDIFQTFFREMVGGGDDEIQEPSLLSRPLLLSPLGKKKPLMGFLFLAIREVGLCCVLVATLFGSLFIFLKGSKQDWPLVASIE